MVNGLHKCAGGRYSKFATPISRLLKSPDLYGVGQGHVIMIMLDKDKACNNVIMLGKGKHVGRGKVM